LGEVSLKVALIVELFYPHIAGSEKRFFEIGKGLVKRGHEVHVFTIRYDAKLPKEEIIEGMFVHRYASAGYITHGVSRSLRGVFTYSFLTLTRLLRQRFDVCYSNEWPIFHSMFAKLAVPCLVQEWCEVWTKPKKITFLQRLLKRCGTYNVAVSEFTSQRLTHFLKLNPQKITIIPNGVDHTQLSYGSENHVWGRLVYVGRLVDHKHTELLFDAFLRIKKTVPEAELHIIGEGPLLAALNEKAAQTEGCFVYGFLPEEAKWALLKTAWVFVLPSEREGFSLVALEAMAVGVPVVTVDFPDNATKEFAKFNCCLVAKPDGASVAKAITKLLDKTVWKGMHEDALSFSQKYDWELVSGQVEDLLHKLVYNA
jgi:glycosyltransferase involved in cell wall biosynthesis